MKQSLLQAGVAYRKCSVSGVPRSSFRPLTSAAHRGGSADSMTFMRIRTCGETIKSIHCSMCNRVSTAPMMMTRNYGR